MITVYICDSSPTGLKKCRDLVFFLMQKNSLLIRIQLFNCGEQLINYYKQYPQDLDILYIDTVLKDQSGIDTVKQLQQLGCTAEVVYLSATDQHALDALDTSPLHYLLKSKTPIKKFEDILLKAYQKVSNHRDDVFTCESGGVTKWISVRTIIYFETQSRVVTVHYDNQQTFSFYSKMESLQTKLENHRFIRTHRSFLVNLKYIKAISKNDLTLYDDTVLPLGVTYSKQVKQEFKAISGPIKFK